MIRSLLILILLSAIWTTALWFGIKPDFIHWPLTKTILIHVIPPLSLWLCLVFLLRYRKVKARKLAEAKEKEVEIQRQAELAAAKQAAEKVLQERQFSCDCRSIVFSDLVVPQPLELPEHFSITQDQYLAEEFNARSKEQTQLDNLNIAIAGSLRSLYRRSAAIAALPIYLWAPASIGLDEVRKRVQTIYQHIIEELALVDAGIPGQAIIRFLPSSNCTTNTIISLFDDTSGLPGAVVLAFDSPILLPSYQDNAKGTPSHGAITLLLTSAQLPEIFASLPKSSSHSLDDNGEPLPDYLRPHWDKPQSVTDNLLSLSKLPAQIREQLISIPVLAKIHKANTGQYAPGNGLALTRRFSGLLTEAQINAALIQPPSPASSDTSKPQEQDDTSKSESCGWIVYNCGDEERNALILPSLLSALYHSEIDLSIRTSTNISTAIGNLGQANGAAMLGLAITRATTLEAPVLNAEFIDEEVAMSFVVPAPKAA